MLTYVRTKLRLDALRRFDSLTTDHSAVGQSCPLCPETFKAGDATTLVALGPGDDPEEREKCAAGGHYNAVAILVHWSCATGFEAANLAWSTANDANSATSTFVDQKSVSLEAVHDLLRRTPMDGEIFCALSDGVDSLAVPSDLPQQ
jgi:hypothetical protein